MDTIFRDRILITNVQDIDWAYKLTGDIKAISPKYPTSNITLSKQDAGDKIPRQGDQVLCQFETDNLKKVDSSAEEQEKTWNWYWKITQYDIDSEGQPDSGDDLWKEAEKGTYNQPAASGNVINRSVVDNIRVPDYTKDLRPEERYRATASNARTALMLAREIMTEDGAMTAKWYEGEDSDAFHLNNDLLFALSDSLFGYIQSRTNGTDFVEWVEPPYESPMVNSLVKDGATITEIKPKPKAPVFEDGTMTIDPDSTVDIKDGVAFKEAVLARGHDLAWAMDRFKRLGIAKSSDYVSSGRGSYNDLLKEIVNLPDEDEGI
jgi:hypothetical protein